MRVQLYRVDWSTPSGELTAVEPRDDEVLAHAPALAVAYNHPRNAPLMGHTTELTEADVVAHYRELAAQRGARNFLLFRDGALAGDADLRGIDGRGLAEFAFMIADPAAQGRGLGTRFAAMIHAFGFHTLDLRRIWASVLPANTASRRVFEKLGYRARPDLPEAHDFVEEGDLALALDRGDLAADPGIRIAPR
ncbi:MAG: GNAT family N-acetyltransferase [Deltaproteobacteria bacterium]|nr:GNAT family N-acetyltransferase [Deltaproteobacteria bacterium]